MKYQESLAAIDALSKELLSSIGKDATVQPHKWNGIKDIANKMATFVRAQGRIVVHTPTPPKAAVPLIEEVIEVVEEPRTLLATSQDKPRKKRKDA